MMPLPQGIPTLDSYARLVESPLFRELTTFSDSFLEKSRRELREYASKWVTDPMRQWSRKWEYPFCYDHVRARVAAKPGASLKVLDAGSGITFFPYLLASKGMAPTCCDIDASLTRMFPHVNRVMGFDVPFTACGLNALPFADGSFDAITCISVLEHCDDYSAIVDEFHRVLCPGGLLALTFDISLDGRWEIPRAKAEDLLRDVGRRFASEDGVDLLRRLESGPVESILSTVYAQKNDPGSLPWGILSDLKSLAKLRLPGRPHKALTCCSIAVLRKDR